MKNLIKRLVRFIMAQFEDEKPEVQAEEVAQPEHQEQPVQGAQPEPTEEQKKEAEDQAASSAEAETKKPSVDDIKQGLDLAGKDVSSVWGDVVAFAEASVEEFEVAAKKALEFIGHEAVIAYDAVIALLKHK